MKVKNNIFFYTICSIFIVAFALIASACSCGEKYKELRVFVDGKQIDYQYSEINIPADADFSITRNIKVCGVLQNGSLEELNLDNNDYEISINPLLTKPLSSGKYEISISCDNKQVKVPLTVRNSDDTITVQKDSSKVYDATPAELPVYTTKSGDDAVVTWYTFDKQEKLTQSPTNAGSYVCELKTSSNNRFTGVTLDVPFTIAKANCEPTTAHTSFETTYNPEQTLANFTLSEFYTWADSSIVPTCDKASYKALYNIDNANYNDCEVDITISVSPAQVTEPEADATEFTYNGEEQTYNVQSSPLYNVSGNTQTFVKVNTNNEVVPHIVTVSLTDKINYIWENAQNNQDLTFDFVINKATPQNVEPLQFIVKTGTASADLEFPNGYSWSTSVGASKPDTFTSVGVQTLKATFTPEDNVNYKQIDVDVTVIVNEQIDEPTMDENITLTYNGSAQYAPLDYEKFDENKIQIVSGEQYTDAGTYNLVVKPKQNYMWSDNTADERQIVWQIEKATFSLMAKNDGNYSSEILKSEYDANYIASDEVVLTNLTDISNRTIDLLPFRLIQNSLPLIDNNTTFSFSVVEDTPYTLNGGYRMYTTSTLDYTTASIGSAYICVTYKLNENKNYVLGQDNTCNLVYNISVVPQQYKVFGTLGIDYTNYNNTLGSITISSANAKVYVLLASAPDSTILNQTEIAGTWAWVDGANTNANPQDTFTAKFTPAQTSELYTGNVEQDVVLNIEIRDTIQAFIRKDGETQKTLVEKDAGSNDSFTYDINYEFKPYYVSFSLPNGCQFSYKVIGGENSIVSSYSAGAEISIPTNTMSTIYSDSTYIVTLYVTGGLNVTKTFTVNLHQNLATINVNGTEWDGVSAVKSGDSITVPVATNQSIYNSVRINGAEQENNTYIVQITDSLITIDYMLDSVKVFGYYLNVDYTAPFESFAINNKAPQDITLNSMNINYQLAYGEDYLTIAFNNALDESEDFVLSYALNNGALTTLPKGDYNISNINVLSSNQLTISVKTEANDLLFMLNITIKQYTRLTNVTYTMANGKQVDSLEDIVILPCFLADIEAELSSPSLQAQITNYGENTLTFGAITNAEQKYTITIFDGENNVLENKTITIKYDIDVFVERENLTLATLNTVETLTALVNRGDNLVLNLDAESDLTLLLYTSSDYNARIISGQISFDNDAYLLNVYAEISYDVNYYLRTTFTLLKTTSVDLNSIFSSTNIIVTTSGFTTNLTLNSNQVTNVTVPVILNKQEFFNSLNDVLNGEYILDSSLYAVYANFDDYSETDNIITMVVRNLNTDERFALFASFVYDGVLNNNTRVNATITDSNGQEKQNCTSIDYTSNTITLTGLQNGDIIRFDAQNSYVKLELYYNSTLLHSSYDYITFLYAGNKEYSLKVYATDGTIATYLLTTNGTFTNFASITINGTDYVTTFDENNDIVGFLSYSENSGYSASFDASSIENFASLSTLNVGIAVDNNIYPTLYSDDGVTQITQGENALAIHPKTAEQSAYIMFYFARSEGEQQIKLPCTIYLLEPEETPEP